VRRNKMKKISTALAGEAMRFIGVGILNTALGFAVFNILGYYVIGLQTSGKYLLCSILTFIVTLTTSFFLNSRFTFRHKHSSRGGVWRFAAVTIGTYAISSLVSVIVFHVLQVHSALSDILIGNISAVVSVGVGMCINFAGYKFFVFHDHIEQS
jgi:putative flippase GtrA